MGLDVGIGTGVMVTVGVGTGVKGVGQAPLVSPCWKWASSDSGATLIV